MRRLYQRHFDDARRERLFLSGVSFLITFAGTRGVTYAIRRGLISSATNVSAGSTRIHHQVFGVTMLVASGYGWLHLGGTHTDTDRGWARAVTLCYGAGSALTLDEFALLLHIEDVYWKRPWREAIDVAILGTALASVVGWGRPFFTALLRDSAEG
jgi:hypothetical protein